MTTTTAQLYALRTETGDVVWSVSGTAPLSAKPVVSHDDRFVYTTRTDGAVTALDVRSGEEAWTLSCSDIQGPTNVTTSVSREAATCVDLIEAEASIAPTGLVLFYGDKYGNVKALNLGISTVPTSSPSGIPTYLITPSPSEHPSESPSGSTAPTSAPTTTAYPTLTPIDWAKLMEQASTATSAEIWAKASIICATMSTIVLAAV